MSILRVLHQYGLCIARVSNEQPDHSWTSPPKTINIAGHAFNYDGKVYVVDSLLGGMALQYVGLNDTARLEIMIEHAAYSIVAKTDNPSRPWTDIYSNNAVIDVKHELKDIIAAIKADQKLKHALERHVNSWNS